MNDDKFQPLHTAHKSIVLIVEDSEHDYEILMRNIQKSNVECEIQHCETGEEALDYLSKIGEYKDAEKYRIPSLVLLDLNLPGTDGREVLGNIKSQKSSLKFIPVVVFSSSHNPKDIEECYQKGVNAYITKPMNMSILQESVRILMLHWLQLNIPYLEPISTTLSR